MENIEFKKASVPWMQKAMNVLAEDKKEVYITKGVIDLESTADTEAWDPIDEIREIVPNVDNVDIEMVGKGKLNDLNKKLRSLGQVGLVVMGSDISRNSRPSLIVLTTDDKLYVIDANDIEFGVTFLKLKINDKENLEFWTTNGVNEADSLYHNYKIDLTKGNVNCCTGLHVHMMQTMRYKTESGLAMYPLVARQRCRNPPRIETFGDLIETWLDIPKQALAFDKHQLPHLNTRPLTQTAINLIKKRCILVCSLIKTMKYYGWLEPKIMSRNAMDRLTSSDDQRIRAAIIREMKKWKERGVSDFGYFIHLDSGISNTAAPI